MTKLVHTSSGWYGSCECGWQGQLWSVDNTKRSSVMALQQTRAHQISAHSAEKSVTEKYPSWSDHYPGDHSMSEHVKYHYGDRRPSPPTRLAENELPGHKIGLKFRKNTLTTGDIAYRPYCSCNKWEYDEWCTLAMSRRLFERHIGDVENQLELF